MPMNDGECEEWFKENEDEIVKFINQAFAKLWHPSAMTGADLTQLIVGRIREIPQDQHYEMIGAYGLVNEFLSCLMQHGIQVVRQKDCWMVRGESGTFFPVTATSALDPGTFILRPRSGVKTMAKKKPKKKDKDDKGKGGY